MSLSNNSIAIIERDSELSESYFNSIAITIKENGAVILRNVIDEDTANTLKDALLRSIKEDEEKRGKDYIFYGMVHALMTRDKSFRDLLENEIVLKTMRAILGHGAIVHAYNSSSMPPSGSNFSRTIHVDCPRLIPNYITNIGLTIALVPFRNDNGAMGIWPSSFDEDEAPSEKDFEKNAVIIDNLEIGDAILFNARCWHRGGVNETQNWRHAATMNICRSYMRQQFDFPKMFTVNEELGFSEDLKQFMGYYVRCPKSIDEFLLPAEQRLYKSGQE